LICCEVLVDDKPIRITFLSAGFNIGELEPKNKFTIFNIRQIVGNWRVLSVFYTKFESC
jgi:hypothetical protein